MILITQLLFSGLTVTSQSTDNFIQASSLFYVDGERGTAYGETVTGVGDYNLDGYEDFMVGGRAWHGWQGQVWMYFGSESGIISNSSAEFKIIGEPNRGAWGLCLGHTIVNLGDVNGDGATDFGVGGPGSYGDWDVGRIYIFYGNADIYPSKAGIDNQQSIESPILYDWFGEAFSSAGDFNGDGFTDIIVGAPGTAWSSDGVVLPFEEGNAYVYYGSSNGFGKTPNVTLSDEGKYTAFGLIIGGGGDINDDGFDDVIVGAPWVDNGAAHVYLGSANPDPNPDADIILTGDGSEILVGEWVRIIDDINNDGIDEIAVKSSEDGTYQTRVSIYFGNEDLTELSKPDLVLEHVENDDGFGFSFETVGDVNSDSYTDIAVGAPGLMGEIGSDYNGKAYIFYGGPEIDNIPDLKYVGENPGDNFGFSISYADVNGDSKSDILITALQYEHMGRTYIHQSTEDGLVEDTKDADLLLIIGLGVVLIVIVVIFLRIKSSKINK